MYSLLLHRNTIDFRIFILYPVILISIHFSSKNILVDSLGFLHIQTSNLQIGAALSPSFMICIHLFSFLALLHWLELPAVC